jgi:hypothetical protein
VMMADDKRRRAASGISAAVESWYREVDSRQRERCKPSCRRRKRARRCRAS